MNNKHIYRNLNIQNQINIVRLNLEYKSFKLAGVGKGC